MLEAVPNSDFTEVEWGAADRSALGHQRPLSSMGRRTIPKQSPNGCPGRLSPHRARKGQQTSARTCLHLYFIELDGSFGLVPLASSATADATAGTLTLSVTEQP